MCVCVCVCVGGGILIFRYLSVTVVLREWVKHKWRREEGRKEGRNEGGKRERKEKDCLMGLCGRYELPTV